eukprot:5440286-Amphidinium_carterae.1
MASGKVTQCTACHVSAHKCRSGMSFATCGIMDIIVSSMSTMSAHPSHGRAPSALSPVRLASEARVMQSSFPAFLKEKVGDFVYQLALERERASQDSSEETQRCQVLGANCECKEGFEQRVRRGLLRCEPIGSVIGAVF